MSSNQLFAEVRITSDERQAYYVFVRVVSVMIVATCIVYLVCAYVFLTKFFYFDFASGFESEKTAAKHRVAGKLGVDGMPRRCRQGGSVV